MLRRNNRGWDVPKRRGVVVLDGLFLVFGVLLIVGAIVVFVWFTLPSITEARASTGWSSTPGRIVHSRIDVSRSSDNERSEKAVVQYLYTVEGVELLGDRVSIGVGFRDATKTKMLYPVGREVEVYLDPERPWRSTLQPGVHFSAQMLFPIVMLVLGIPFTLLPLRSLRKGRGGSADIEKKMPAKVGGCLVVLGCAIFLFGCAITVVLVVQFGRETIDHARGFVWTVCNGIVLESHFERAEAKPQEWIGHIEFEYDNQGTVYRSTAYRYEVLMPGRPGPEAIYTHRPGDAVRVYAKQFDPTAGFLDISTPAETLGFAALFFLVPGGMALIGFAFMIQGIVILRRRVS